MSESGKAVFLSYASQDADAARRVCEALRGVGVEVWLDQDGGLVGGDAWDAKIRGQIASCALFVPIISANTQARLEGYFRLEWKLAAQRTHTMADEKAFLLPVVIDDTRDAEARVPAEFKAVQWTRLPAGETSPRFCARVNALLEGSNAGPAANRAPGQRPGLSQTPEKKRAAVWSARAFAAGIAAIVAFAVWQPWKTPSSAGTKTPAAGTAPLSEARKLALQAKALLDDDPLLVRENFQAAERFSLRAIELDPADSEAWAVAARAGTVLARDYQDRSPGRAESVRSRVETAMRLAPDSIEAGLARALYDYHFGLGSQAALDRLEALAERAPTDRRLFETATRLAFRSSAGVRATEGTPRERWAERADALPGGSAVAFSERARHYWVLGDLPAMETAVSRSLAIRPTSQGYYWKLVLLVWGWGELDAARAVLKTLPGSLLQEDSFVLLAYHVESWSRNFDAAVAVLNRTPRAFLEDFSIFYPRGHLSGEALAHGGKTRAAEIQRRSALREVEERAAREPNSSGLMTWKARVLASLGETEQARQAFEVAEEMGSPATRWTNSLEVERHVLFGRTEEAVAAAEMMLDRTKRRWPLALNELRFEPGYEPLRRNPRIQSLIASAQGWLAEMKAGANVNPPTASVVTTSAPPDPKSIAVLAFANMSPDKEATEYFSDGISDEILNALDRNPALRVTPRTSSFSFKGRNVPLDEIGRTLRVASVIEGSVKKAGNEVRITVKLLDAATGARVWSEEFVRQLTTAEIFAVQSEIAAKVAGKLGGVAIAPAASVSFPAGAQTANLEAHDFYLRGLALQMAPQSASTRLEIVELYREATRRDPGYALAWARMSEVFLILRIGAFDRSPETAAKAVEAASTALRLAPHLPEAQLAVARVRLNIDGDHDATQRALDEVARLAPNNAEAALLRAELERARGRWGESLAQLCGRAAELDPQNAISLSRVSALLNTMGRFAEADRLSRRSWELSQAFSQAIRRRASIRLAWVGDAKGALEILDSAPRPDSLVFQLRARLHEILGDLGSAMADNEKGRSAERRQSTTSGPRGSIVMASYQLARIQPERAAEHLDEALRLARRFVADFPDLHEGPLYLALIHAARGEREDALAALADAMARVARTRDANQIARMRQNRAEVLTLLGEKEAAIADLQAVYDMGYGFGYMLRLDPDWAPLRAEPKFQQLMKAAEALADAQPRPKQ